MRSCSLLYVKKIKTAMARIVFVLSLLIALTVSCQKDDTQGGKDDFDRELMLKNYAENLIVPAYRDAQLAVNQLITAIEALAGSPTPQQLASAQSAWVNAYGEWMHANAFNLGPAAEQGLNRSLSEEIATFPVAVQKIEAAISAGQFNFNDFNRDARGFLALEYLLFADPGTSPEAVVALLQSQPSRQTYLLQCARNLQSRLNTVVQAWDNGYTATFTSNAGTDVGSSTSMLYNEFVKAFETNKNLKIELPLGSRPGQTQAEPMRVEAYYSGKSADFLNIHLTAIENIYRGRSKNGTDGPGFKDYLETVTGGPALVEATRSQWEKVLAAAGGLPAGTRLSDLIVNNPQPVRDLQLELQKHVRFFKSDMSSLLGIAITYSSGDGD
jgi:uncharacterized protein